VRRAAVGSSVLQRAGPGFTPLTGALGRPGIIGIYAAFDVPGKNQPLTRVEFNRITFRNGNARDLVLDNTAGGALYMATVSLPGTLSSKRTLVITNNCKFVDNVAWCGALAKRLGIGRQTHALQRA
jgi:hypothetical protein